MNPPSSVNDIGPLKRLTNWHEHLDSLLENEEKVEVLLAWLQPPARGESWIGPSLRATISLYIKACQKRAKEATVLIRSLLMAYPAKSGLNWQPLEHKESLQSYGRLLHQWTHAIFVSMSKVDVESEDGDDYKRSSYQLPFTEADCERAHALQAAVENSAANLEDESQPDKEIAAVTAFYKFIKPFLYPKDRSVSERPFSKWDDVFECLIALSALQLGGTFRAAKDATQIFAKLIYHIWSTIIYEAYENQREFGQNIYKWFFFFTFF